MNNHSFKMFHESSILFINGQSSGQTCSWISEIYIYTTRCILLLIIYKPFGGGGFISLGFSPLFTLFVIYILFCFCGNMYLVNTVNNFFSYDYIILFLIRTYNNTKGVNKMYRIANEVKMHKYRFTDNG
jgi:hypothetical protein